MKKKMLNWCKAAGIRAIKTIAQTAVSFLTVGTAIGQVDWVMILSVSVVAGIASLLTSIAGLPELKDENEDEEEGGDKDA